MPFDGFVTKCIAEELNIILAGGRVDKIQQPERDEVHLAVRNNGKNYRLLICSNAASPRIHLTGSAKENPERAPMFCMVLRKHIGGGRIVGIVARDLERVVEIKIESANELGDMSAKTLIAEIMGKHSNIILINDNGRIIDSIVHVDQDMSSVREIMPARVYAPPPPQDKLIPGAGEEACGAIIGRVASWLDDQPMKKIGAALLEATMGASPLFCRELCHRAGIDALTPLALIGAGELGALRGALAAVMRDAFNEKYAPGIAIAGAGAAGAGVAGENPAGGVIPAAGTNSLLDFYCWEIKTSGAAFLRYDTMSEAVDEFYAGRARAASLAQRKAWLVKLVTGHIARCKKKLALHQESMREVADYEIFKLFGELITANIHNIGQGVENVSLLNYYSESGTECVDIALDSGLSPQSNAQAYFRKYRKAASTRKNAEIQAAESGRELEYFESVLQELDMSRDNAEIEEIRLELASQKYVSDGLGKHGRAGKHAGNGAKRTGGAKRSGSGGAKRSGSGGAQRSGGGGAHGTIKGGGRRSDEPSAPHVFISSDGLTIFVGKNNRQNDRLALKTAASNDIWLHARGIPGSHVLIKKQQGDIPESTLLEAASLAAYFSKARMGENVGVDYTAARHVRKPSGAKPGMVIYDNQRTINATPNETLLSRLTKKLVAQ